MIKSEVLVIIRRLYYSTWLMFIVVIINLLDFNNLTADNEFGIPHFIWLIFITFVVGIIVAIILDILIISGHGIQEISFGLAKISRVEIKENIEEQKTNIDNLVNIIEAEYKTIQSIEEYIKNKGIEEHLINDFNSFSYIDELMDIVKYYYDLLNIQKNVSYIYLEEDHVEKILNEKYKIKEKLICYIINELNNNKSYVIKQFSSYYLFIPYRLFTNEKIVIIIDSNEATYELEQRVILNILKVFENDLINLIYELN